MFICCSEIVVTEHCRSQCMRPRCVRFRWSFRHRWWNTHNIPHMSQLECQQQQQQHSSQETTLKWSTFSFVRIGTHPSCVVAAPLNDTLIRGNAVANHPLNMSTFFGKCIPIRKHTPATHLPALREQAVADVEELHSSHCLRSLNLTTMRWLMSGDTISVWHITCACVCVCGWIFVRKQVLLWATHCEGMFFLLALLFSFGSRVRDDYKLSELSAILHRIEPNDKLLLMATHQ